MQRIKGGAAWIWKFLSYHEEANLFLAITLCAGVAMACISPPFQECDGWTHYLLATEVSYGNLLSPVADLPSHQAGRIIVPKNLDEIDYHLIEAASGEGGKYIRYLKTVKFSEQKGDLEMAGRFVSLYYYPQALGLWIGRVLKMNVYGSVVLSRVLNLMLFLVLSYMAIRITPILKNLMAAIAMLPMAVFQAASDSPDSMLNGLCLLFTAICFSCAYGEKERLKWIDACKIGALLGVIFLYKYVYVCLGMLVFLIPMKKFGSRKAYWQCFFLALVPLLVCGYIGIGNAISAAEAGQSVSGAGGVTQTQYLMEHPKLILQVLLGTFLYKFGEYVMMLNVLGSLNYPLGALQFIIPMFLIFAGCIDMSASCSKIKLKDKFFCVVTVLAIGIGLVMAMYIAEGRGNEVGATIAEGVQGRYFIPILPALFVAIQQKGMQNAIQHVTGKVIGGMSLFLLCSIYILNLYCF